MLKHEVPDPDWKWRPLLSFLITVSPATALPLNVAPPLVAILVKSAPDVTFKQRFVLTPAPSVKNPPLTRPTVRVAVEDISEFVVRDVAEATPKFGVTSVGEVANTFEPLPVEVVVPVPPLATGRAVPDRVILTLGVVVGLTTVAERNVGTVAATEVTVPPETTGVVHDNTPEPFVEST